SHFYILTGKNQCCRCICRFNSDFPCSSCFIAVCRTNCIQVRNCTKAGELLDRFMRRAVFTHCDRVVRQYIRYRELHQCTETDCRLQVVTEYKERSAVRPDAAVCRHTVQCCCHCKFTHTEPYIFSGIVVFAEVFLAADGSFVTARKVSCTAEQ